MIEEPGEIALSETGTQQIDGQSDSQKAQYHIGNAADGQFPMNQYDGCVHIQNHCVEHKSRSQHLVGQDPNDAGITGRRFLGQQGAAKQREEDESDKYRYIGKHLVNAVPPACEKIQDTPEYSLQHQQ